MYQSKDQQKKKNQFDINFSRRSLVVVAAAVACGGCYLYNQHWLANNIIGLCFAIQGVEMLSLPNYKTGAMLLGKFYYFLISMLSKLSRLCEILTVLELSEVCRFSQNRTIFK